MDKIQEEFQQINHDSEVMQSFGIALYNQYNYNKAYRRPKEMEWLEDLRQYKGLYDPTITIDAQASHVYPKITRSKINTVLSRLHDMLFPEFDRNFEIDPTPDPSLDESIVMKIAMSLVKQPEIDPQTGQPAIDPATGQPQKPVIPSAEEIQQGIEDFAKSHAKNMQRKIDDQLHEMDYAAETKKILRSGLQYGTGVLAGPLFSSRKKTHWKVDDKIKAYVEKVSKEDVPYMEFVRIWDWYPDMSVCEINQAGGFFQRAVLTKHDLRQLCKRPDFYDDIIKSYIKDHPDGDYVPEQWEIDLQSIEVEAGTKEGSTTVIKPAGSSDNTRSSSYRQGGKKYEVLQFWGYIDGSDLAACGLYDESGKELDESLEYAAHVWILGKKIIKAMLFEGALDHYKVFYYEKDETSIFGEGLARVMRHSQLAVADASRMVLDNGACVAGPQIEVNWQLLHEGSDLNSFYPRKIWYRDGKGVDAQYPAIRVYNIDSHIEELSSIITLFMNFADTETCLPTWLTNEPVNNENSKQTSGKQSSITVSIKDIAKNFDNFTESVVMGLYNWNMEFSSDDNIKGDMKCSPKAVSLVMKEIRMAALANLKNTLQPEDWPYIPRREFLSQTFKAHDIDIQLRSEEEAQKIIASQRDEKMQELLYQQLEAENAYKRAQASSQLTKAKKLNVEAEKDAQTPIEAPANAQPDPRLQDAELESANMEVAASAEQMRRDEEKHQLDMQIAHDDHIANTVTNATKVEAELINKNKLTDHSMKMKEKDQKVREMQAKKQPAAVATKPKPVKKEK